MGGGGRYDGRIGQLKGSDKSEPAVGFAIGLERLLLLIEAVNPFNPVSACDVFVVAHPDVYTQAVKFAHELRTQRVDLRVKMGSATSLKAQMKKADKSGARFTVIIGEDEVKHEQISIKDMQNAEQTTQSQAWCVANLLK